MNAHRVETKLLQDGQLTLSDLPFQAGEAVEVIILGHPAKPSPEAEKGQAPQKPRALKRPRPQTIPFTLKGSLELCCSPAELEEEMQHIRSTWTEAARQSSVELARELARK